jgi:hypothetical protein
MKKPRDIVELLASTIQKLNAGEIDHKRANAIGFLATIMLGIMKDEIQEYKDNHPWDYNI